MNYSPYSRRGTAGQHIAGGRDMHGGRDGSSRPTPLPVQANMAS